MRFGMGVPQMAIADAVDAITVRRFAMTAEEEGYDSLWVMETGVRRGPAPAEIAAIPLLSYLAALTNRVRIGTSVLLPGLRDPRWLAQELTSIDRLSGGRLTVGVGLGIPLRAEWLGIERSEWPARFIESLEVINALWAPGQADFTGRFWDVAGMSIEPKPIQQPRPPLWFGAHAPAALRRAVQLGDGWMGAGASSTETFVGQYGMIREFLEEAGRSEDDFGISKRVYIHVDRDVAAAEERVRAFFQAYYGNPDLGPEVTVIGPPDKCVEELAGLHDAGAGHLVLNPMFDFLDQLEIITAQVLPGLP